VFERFRKGKSAGLGSGLGLAIVRAVASGHGGQVGFVDQPGCTLRVTLPLE
jgi:signal transduction histidine kinase